MSLTKWNESGRVWEEGHGLLDAEQVSKCERADVAEPHGSPVDTRMISGAGLKGHQTTIFKPSAPYPRWVPEVARGGSSCR